ncbi:unnamed protein product [Polarella glacialis]|uniref:Cathepsin propeptide inhibitor domain-containing protein n=1 Tax=Polarella glacialis TaxID=89957 RepID=A0A813DKF0_POLGL|nr:unnamed protein product [Polarella glacialis]
MSRTAALIFGAAVALEWRQSAATQDLPALRKDFDKFVVDFGKDYDAADREVRFAAFVENMKYIEDENKKGKSYKVGLNEFSDMTPDEPFPQFEAFLSRSLVGESSRVWARTGTWQFPANRFAAPEELFRLCIVTYVLQLCFSGQMLRSAM